MGIDRVQYGPGCFRVLKKTLESPYTTKVNYRIRTTRGTTHVAGCASFLHPADNSSAVADAPVSMCSRLPRCAPFKPPRRLAPTCPTHLDPRWTRLSSGLVACRPYLGHVGWRPCIGSQLCKAPVLEPRGVLVILRNPPSYIAILSACTSPSCCPQSSGRRSGLRVRTG